MKKRITHTFTHRMAKAFQDAITKAAGVALYKSGDVSEILIASQYLIKLAVRIDAETEFNNGCTLSIDQNTGKVIRTLYDEGYLNDIAVLPSAVAINNAFLGIKPKKISHKNKVRKTFNRY